MVLFILGIDENGKHTGGSITNHLGEAMDHTLSEMTNRGIITKVGSKLMLTLVQSVT